MGGEGSGGRGGGEGEVRDCLWDMGEMHQVVCGHVVRRKMQRKDSAEGCSGKTQRRGVDEKMRGGWRAGKTQARMGGAGGGAALPRP